MKKKLAIGFIIFFGLVMYALTVRGVPGNVTTSEEYKKLSAASGPFESSHERAPYMQYLEITQNHRYDLTKEQADFATPDVGFSKGKFFSYFPPGISWLLIPLHAVGNNFNLGLVFSYFTMCIFSVLALYFIFKILNNIFKTPMWASLFAVMGVGFGTIFWNFSITIYQHTMTVFLFVSAFYAVWKYKQNQTFSWIWACYVWIAYAFSFFIDYPNAVLLLPVIVYFFVVSLQVQKDEQGYRFGIRPAILWTFLIFVGIGIYHLHYNKINFGSYKQFSNTLPRYETKNFNQLSNATPEEIAQKTGNVEGVFQESSLIRGFFELTSAFDKGMFIFSPILILVFFAVFKLRKKLSLELGVLYAMIGINIFLYASFHDPWGGWAFGPRYIILAMAVIMIVISIWLGSSRKSVWVRLLAMILFAASSAITLLGTLTSNLVPPKVEADYFHLKYGFMYDYQFLKMGKSGSFVYNAYLSSHISLEGYLIILYTILLISAGVILFILPRFEHEF